MNSQPQLPQTTLKISPEYVDVPPEEKDGFYYGGFAPGRWHELHYVLACGGRHVVRMEPDGSTSERIWCKDTDFRVVYFVKS